MSVREFALTVLTLTALFGARAFADLPITTLASFNGSNGQYPQGGVAISGNTLYGTTNAGGFYGDGTVFSVSVTGGTPAVLASFDGTNGLGPLAGVTLSGNTLYGTTQYGGSQGLGAVYSLPTAGGTPTVLASLSSSTGEYPSAGVLLSGNTLYSTTRGGTVFSAPISGGGPTILASVGDSWGSLTLSGSNLYGTTIGGTIFSVPTTGGPATVLATLSGDSPRAGLLLSNGTLYGTTNAGGINGAGTVFSIPVTGGTPKVLASFDGLNESNPTGGLVISGNTLYGMTQFGGANNDGAIFSVPITGGTPTIVASFNGNNGANPVGSLTLSGNTFYGTTDAGGIYGYGTAFSLALPSSSSWAQPISGTWSVGSNWNTSTVPQSNIDAHFSTGGTTPYTVGLTGPSAANNLTVAGDNVTLAVGHNELALAGSLIVSESGNLAGALLVTGTKGSIVAPGGVFVGSVSSTPKSASLTINGTTITGNVTNHGSFQPLGSPTVGGNVTNNGQFSTWVRNGAGAGNVVTINGDYTQTPSATLSMQVAGPTSYDQVNVSGTARLAGTLDISWSGSATPALGNTFPILSYGAVSGRFSTMNGAVIKDTSGNPISAASSEFFGLLYGKNTLNLITLQVPQRTNGASLTSQGAGGLVLLTHGWNSNAAAWAAPDAINIQAAKSQSGVPISQNWDVVSMDWSQYSGYTGNVVPSILPTTAATNANDIGESLANWMQEKGFNYQNLHLVGHSAGSWLINGLTNGLRVQGSNAFIQQTFLDAYNPSGLAFNGYTSLNIPTLGSYANYAEQYYDGVNGGLPGLATAIPGAVNYDVSGLWQYLNYTPVGDHQWPYVWYGQTILAPAGSDSANGYGFGQAIEYTGKVPTFAPGTKGARVFLPSGVIYNTTQYGASVDLLSNNHVISGTVQSGGVGIVQFSAGTATPDVAGAVSTVKQLAALANASSPSALPAILNDQIMLTSNANIMTFGGEFPSSGHGLLTAYFDGTQVAQIDEIDVGSDSWSAGDVYLGADFQQGIHTLMFRLDAYDGLASTVDVTNVAFGEAAFSVPEPTTSSVVLSGVFVLLLVRPGRAWTASMECGCTNY
jgi:uncharacterized repeat protein (TIGR03803 family)